MRNNKIFFLNILLIVVFMPACTEKLDIQIENDRKETTKINLVEKSIKDMRSFFVSVKSLNTTPNTDYYLDNNDTLAIMLQYPNGYTVYANNPNYDLLVISENGNIYDDLKHNAFNNLIKDIAVRSNESYRSEIPDTPITIRYPVYDTLYTQKPPMIDVHWHQYAPFNMYALNKTKKLAGCTMVAIGQIMSYYKYPSSISLTYSNADVSETMLDWDKMKWHTTGHGYDCQYCQQNARLMRQISHICHATYYDSTGTGAWPKVDYLKRLGYSGKEYDHFSIDNIMSSLENNNPCIISGFNDTTGHSWNIDGYRKIAYQCITYEKTHPNSIPQEVGREERTDTYLHFNYGYGGSGDGFILSNRRETGYGGHLASSYDRTPISIFTGDFPKVRMLVTDIQPY